LEARTWRRYAMTQLERAEEKVIPTWSKPKCGALEQVKKRKFQCLRGEFLDE